MAAPLKPRPHRRVIALVGGLGKWAHDPGEDVELRHFGSVKDRGRGELRRLLASLRHGGIDEVRLFTSWLGHSQSRAITKLCKKLGIPVRCDDRRGRGAPRDPNPT